MAEKSIKRLLHESFPKTDKADWIKTAISELNGNEPFKTLTWIDEDAIKHLPYYDSEDVNQLSLYDKFNLQPTDNAFLGNREWFNCPRITVTDVSAANKMSLEHLANGADGLLFELSEKNSDGLDKLLENIHYQYCFLAFTGVNQQFVGKLSALYEKIPDEKSPGGMILIDNFPDSAANAFVSGNRLISYCLRVASDSPAREISTALTRAVSFLSAVDENKYSSIFDQIAFSLTVSGDFVTQIAKMKALRILWYQVTQAYGLTSYSPEHLHIHAEVRAAINESYQPHGNMLTSTTGAMAAIIGGCNSLTVIPENENSPMMRRIARNVSNILREESHFDKVADPLAGAYVVETLTQQICEQAWSQFQQTIR